MNKFSDILTEDRRLVILRALAQDLGYSHNESILQSILERYGHHVSRSLVRTDLAWLEEQGLVRLDMVGETTIATVTDRGADVAHGRALAPGVKRPNPGEQ